MLSIESRDALACDIEQAIERMAPMAVRGRVSQALGLLVEAQGIRARVGEVCELAVPGETPLLAEVIGFRQQTALLTPLGPITGLSSGTEVLPTGRGLGCPVGPAVLGRVLDGLGRPIDGRGPLHAEDWQPVHRAAVEPLERGLVRQVFETGVRVVDALLTIGIGQRVGIFSPPGVGKTTLLGMLMRGSSADVNVVVLVGERGREVREFIEQNLSESVRARTVLVASTSDRPPMERIKSAQLATTMAEYFRDQGLRVLLLTDSLTRLARAQREIGLASGEPPTRRSYPPSVFALLPQLLERAGPGRVGSITAAYTVLTEGEDDSDPIAEEVRSILDGHIVLSRRLAEANQFPAVDALASISRVMPQLVTAVHGRAAAQLRHLQAHYKEIELLLQIGEYQPGRDALADQAVRLREPIRAFLSQDSGAGTRFEHTVKALCRLVGEEAAK